MIYLSFSSLILTSCMFAEENSLNFCGKFQIEVSKCKPGVFSYIASGTVIGINESKSVKFFFSVYITMINYKVCVLLHLSLFSGLKVSAISCSGTSTIFPISFLSSLPVLILINREVKSHAFLNLRHLVGSLFLNISSSVWSPWNMFYCTLFCQHTFSIKKKDTSMLVSLKTARE